MNSSKFSSIFATCVGSLMVLIWIFLIVGGKVPEFQTQPTEIVLHVVDEFLTALVLLISGVFSLLQSRRAHVSLLAGFGMLCYTLVVSPGYYLQNNQVPAVIMFGVLLVGTIIALILQIRKILISTR